LYLCLICTLVSAEEKPSLPDGLKGFSGMLEGTVISKEEKGFILEVHKILNLWKNNKANNPESAIDKELLINVQWEKGKDGTWHPVEAHLKFINSLKVGEEIKIEVINDEGERLHILELSKEQRERAEKVEAGEDEIHAGKPEYLARDGKEWKQDGRIVGHLRDAPHFKAEVIDESGRVIKSIIVKEKAGAYEIEWLKPGVYILRIIAEGYKTLEKKVEVKAENDLFIVLEFVAKKQEKPSLPDGLKGFSGMLEGTVISKEEKGFILEVQKILNLWKNNKANNPESAIDEGLLINVQWEKGKDGTWHPVEAHLKFINSLKVGEEIKIEVINDEGERLHILELSKEQRERAEKVKSEKGED